MTKECFNVDASTSSAQAINDNREYVAAVNQLKVWDYEYFQLNSPTVSDVEYDRLYDLVQGYEQGHPSEVLADSSTQVIRTEVKNGHRQVVRRTPMLSTQKAQKVEQVEKWMVSTNKRICGLNGEKTSGKSGNPFVTLYTVEWKYDGVSVSLVYQDGRLTEASYGKGSEGNDCLSHCLAVKSIPNYISAKGRVEVRGELVVPFANLAQTGYKNCRSAAAGILADTFFVDADLLEFHPYWCEGLNPASYHYHYNKGCELLPRLNVLEELGFLYVRGSEITAEQVVDYIAMYTEGRNQLSFPVDGLVIKVADMDIWDSLGATEHHPKYSIAYKFAAETAETTITRIEITTGKTGKRTPVAYYEPVVINGATYQKASIGSEKKLAELDLHVGDRVVVSLRNDVIPHIDGKVANENENSGQVVNENENEGTIQRQSEDNSVVDNDNNGQTDIVDVNSTTEDTEDTEVPVIDNSCNQRNSHDTEPHVIEPVRNQRPRRRYAKREKTEIPVIDRNKGIMDNNDNFCSDKTSKTEKVIAGVLAGVAVCVVGVVLFASLGAAVFLLPLIGGTLLKA